MKISESPSFVVLDLLPFSAHVSSPSVRLQLQKCKNPAPFQNSIEVFQSSLELRRYVAQAERITRQRTTIQNESRQQNQDPALDIAKGVPTCEIGRVPSSDNADQPNLVRRVSGGELQAELENTASINHQSAFEKGTEKNKIENDRVYEEREVGDQQSSGILRAFFRGRRLCGRVWVLDVSQQQQLIHLDRLFSRYPLGNEGLTLAAVNRFTLQNNAPQLEYKSGINEEERHVVMKNSPTTTKKIQTNDAATVCPNKEASSCGQFCAFIACILEEERSPPRNDRYTEGCMSDRFVDEPPLQLLNSLPTRKAKIMKKVDIIVDWNADELLALHAGSLAQWDAVLQLQYLAYSQIQ